LRRARRSSADKTSTRIANYWDRTALACCRHSKRVEPSRKIGSTRLGVCVVCVRCMLCRCKNDCWPQLCFYRPIAMLRLFCYFFSHEFLFNPHFDLEPDYIIRKPIFHRIQRCNLRREILSTFHTRVDHRSVRHFCIVFTSKLPLPFRRSPPKSNTPIPSPTPLTTPNGIRILSAVLPLLTCAGRQMGQAKALSHERSAHRATR